MFFLKNNNRGINKERFLKGFTLVEILVVVSIIGIITTIVITNLNSAKDKATDVKSVQELDQLKKALELYRTDNGKYPGLDNTEYGPSQRTECVFNTQTMTNDCEDIPYSGTAINLFNNELVEKNYISAIPYYVADENDFRYLTGEHAKSYDCGGQNYSNYLIVFYNNNYDLKMSKIIGEGNCEEGNSCIYCFGY